MSAQTTNWSFYAAGISAFLIGLFLGGFLFGMVVHENSHAIICILFGLPFSWSLTQVVYVKSPNPLVNILVGLAGGIGQALFSMFFLWYATTWEKRAFVKSLSDFRRPPLLSMFFGFELAFLTIAFHGIVNAIWEGLFYESYQQIHANNILWGAILLFSGIISFYIVYRRYLRLTVPKWKFTNKLLRQFYMNRLSFLLFAGRGNNDRFVLYREPILSYLQIPSSRLN